MTDKIETFRKRIRGEMTDDQKKRANALANDLMRKDGLDPVKDQKKRPAYFTKACEIILSEESK